jgi:hypothetical protein
MYEPVIITNYSDSQSDPVAPICIIYANLHIITSDLTSKYTEQYNCLMQKLETAKFLSNRTDQPFISFSCGVFGEFSDRSLNHLILLGTDYEFETC